MTAPPPPTPPTGPDDRSDPDRDPRVAGWLAVEPLDDVTRTRLVGTALAGAAAASSADTADARTAAGDPAVTPIGPRRRSPYATLVSVAAAVLVALVVVGAVLLPGDGDDSTRTAKGTPPTASASAASGQAGDSARAPQDSALAEADAVPLALPSLGDLGDVSTEARLARAARVAFAAGPNASTTPVIGCAVTEAGALGTPAAAGTGTIDGRPAVIVVVAGGSGANAAVAVRVPSCGRTVSAALP